MSWSVFRRQWVLTAGLVLALGARAAAAPTPDDAAVALTPDRVLASLNLTLTWYQQARVTMQTVDDGSGVADTREDKQTAVAILRRAFDVARAEAAALATAPSAAAGETATAQPAAPSSDLDARIQQDEQDRARLSALARTAPPGRRAELQRQVAAARNRLELDRARADFATRLKQLDDALPAAPADLARQITALQDGVPELRDRAGPEAPAAARTEAAGGTWPLITRLLNLVHARSTLAQLAGATVAREQAVAADLQAIQAELHPVFARLRTLADNPGAGGDLVGDQRQFHDALEHGKRLAAVVVPAREERALLHRYAADLTEWQRAVDDRTNQVLRGIGIELVRVAIAVAVLLVGAVLWRVAVVRYVGDAYRRHLLLTARNVVIGTAIVLVVAFHFTSELGALVTGLGFAAAGIAFALQTIILAVAGYFAMVAPNGIRAGDRVSLQGPFSYVHGEVAEIGFVRIKLRELAGDPPQPTGRIVVFPNSVVFTGSFFKHPEPAST